jgi:5-methylcytosine-specific restriction protein A
LNSIEPHLKRLIAAGVGQLEAELGPATSRAHFVETSAGLIHAAQLYNALLLHDGLPREELDFRGMRPAEIGAVCGRLQAAGFEVRSYAHVRPPQLGRTYANRTAIMNEYGGTKQQGIWYFAGDSTLNVYSRIGGPYPDDPPSDSEPFVYRGEGLRGDQSFHAPGNRYLTEALATASPVRFWYGPKGGPIVFHMWCVVVGRNWTRGVGDNGIDRREIAWRLRRVPSPDPSHWPAEIDELRALSDDGPSDEAAPEGQPDPGYQELLARVNAHAGSQPRRGLGRLTYGRQEAARRAVLKRARFTCESPRCTGMPPELTRKGEPILEVDHIVELSQGGADTPANMVSLCPNCHAAKTRGPNPLRWRRELLEVARRHHQEAVQEIHS